MIFKLLHLLFVVNGVSLDWKDPSCGRFEFAHKSQDKNKYVVHYLNASWKLTVFEISRISGLINL